MAIPNQIIGTTSINVLNAVQRLPPNIEIVKE
ncbi:hypothetical protein VCSRO95_3286 [Vibrio cholerae]|nr:hypothetical protein VCSRO95_3286 [Vibrio cholerae]